ncbi:PRC-barrel domain-containing protein [bacterium]|nr:PRC-barrel domain-containing protein [bacterium]
MLQYSHEFKENQVKTRDGRFGKVSDVIISNDAWDIKYIVIDVGGWLFNRKVLLSTNHLELREGEDCDLSTMLTMNQLKTNPQWTGNKPFTYRNRTIFSHLPVYPAYGGLGFPWLFSSISLNPINDMGVAAMEDQANTEADEQKLQSINEVRTYRIAASDKEIGCVEDFLVEDKTWTVPYLLICVGNSCGKNVLISSNQITGMNDAESLITTTISSKQIEACPEYNPEKSIEGIMRS